MDDDAALEAAAEFPERDARLVLEEAGCCGSRTEQSPRLSTTAGRNSTSGDGGINLGEKFRKALKNDSF
ncbi:hypothetical protein ACCS91_34945 [Rhizobium ruizarguesonis]|uniref:hypothetical protein n=1 Tax=Rhizobium ruizarguesonis TaxID=2081791 RepID=UPI00102F9636|nr:hypothetical protein [Rhizobium ruizarguesonis]NEH31466.1 hypothetical protein [Rhizobium ruizarguesonis]NEK11910.1 hypothetical protein [Rhizobium ruizarguesonis]TAW67677.1 hypothetical protein ELI10_29130 [Rhizobium ruizarguesonis]TAX03670.1 hypothetical protein ELI09_29800 [Rhizobium ruizarguesonis]TAX06648.1 hypothetical protein ELI08_29120 [Rhizobium ruizarguesonis]